MQQAPYSPIAYRVIEHEDGARWGEILCPLCRRIVLISSPEAAEMIVKAAAEGKIHPSLTVSIALHAFSCRGESKEASRGKAGERKERRGRAAGPG